MTDLQSREIRLWVPGPPIAQQRPRAVAVKGKARVYHPNGASKQYKRQIALKARQAFSDPLAGPVVLALRFCMPRPKSRVWKTKEMPREWHTKKPDIDNLMKSVMDALNGIAWHDDSQVCETRAMKCVASGYETSGSWIAIAPADHLLPISAVFDTPSPGR